LRSAKVDNRLSPFIKDIIILEDTSRGLHSLPFYADGYPGILYSECKEGVVLKPLNKLLPNFFLYGQTIEPISLDLDGPYKMIVFLLYPFATRLLLSINPKEINDACYDLKQVNNIDTEDTITRLSKSKTDEQVKIVSDYILRLVKNSSSNLDTVIKLAISTIINEKGNVTIKNLRERLYITERTFERRFKNEIGVSPKQFARIIQFNFSLNKLQEADYTKFTNIAYENGYTDQSHFIKTFKKYTGATPKEVLASMN